MKIATFATFMSPLGSAAMIADFARRAEAAGLDSIWMGEHVVLFDEMEFPYPGSRDGRIPVPEGGGLLDPVATFGYLAGVTTRIRFGTGITLLPQRNPVYTAKEFATLDWLTGGRIDFGVGVGWCKEEVIACGYSFEDRGQRCDEFLELLHLLWTEPVTNYSGRHVSVTACRLDPKPVQSPFPVLVGGHSPAALRRAARFGTGWYGFGLSPKATTEMLARVDAALAAEGRTRSGFEIVITPPFRADEKMVRQFRDLGVDRLVVQLGSQQEDAVARRLDELGKMVGAAA